MRTQRLLSLSIFSLYLDISLIMILSLIFIHTHTDTSAQQAKDPYTKTPLFLSFSSSFNISLMMILSLICIHIHADTSAQKAKYPYTPPSSLSLSLSRLDLSICLSTGLHHASFASPFIAVSYFLHHFIAVWYSLHHYHHGSTLLGDQASYVNEAADRLSDLVFERRMHALEQRLMQKLGGQKSFHGKFRPTLRRTNH